MASDAPRKRLIIAQHDAEGLFVYQAFRPTIVKEAVRLGTFGKGFNYDRMTWIKPSFGWMLYRSGYATKHRQEAILKIKLSHDGVLALLRRSIATSYDRRLFGSESEWSHALRRTDVRHQWDPDRDWSLHPLERRAIQIGLEGEAVRLYVGAILHLEDVTALAHVCRDAAARRLDRPAEYPEEKEYPVPEDVRKILGM